jgi:hypothetical protein
LGQDAARWIAEMADHPFALFTDCSLLGFARRGELIASSFALIYALFRVDFGGR